LTHTYNVHGYIYIIQTQIPTSSFTNTLSHTHTSAAANRRAHEESFEIQEYTCIQMYIDISIYTTHSYPHALSHTHTLSDLSSSQPSLMKGHPKFEVGSRSYALLLVDLFFFCLHQKKPNKFNPKKRRVSQKKERVHSFLIPSNKKSQRATFDSSRSHALLFVLFFSSVSKTKHVKPKKEIVYFFLIPSKKK